MHTDPGEYYEIEMEPGEYYDLESGYILREPGGDAACQLAADLEVFYQTATLMLPLLCY